MWRLVSLLAFFSLMGCQVGTLDQANSSIGSTPGTHSLNITGYLGVGALARATIIILDVTDFESPKVISSLESDENGSFSFTIKDSNEIDLIMITANGGTYVDPFAFSSISASDYQLRALYDGDQLKDRPQIYITPFSSLFTALFECLYYHSSVSQDPYIYAFSIFNDIFDVDILDAEDIFLNPEADTNENSNLYTLYNLAFSKMAQNKKAQSGLDLSSHFADTILNTCSLITEEQKISKQYAFFEESFRSDYLDALLNVRADPRFSSFSDSTDLNKLITTMRNDRSLIFGFKSYE